MARATMVTVVLIGVLFVGASAVYAFRWPLVNALIRREFRDVPRISTAELASWLADTSRPAPLLIDARTRAEYEVSHLPDAKHGGWDTDFDLAQEPRDRAIVVYCSIGYRSAKFAHALRESGRTNVRNLEGSIFKWANEGRPVFRGDEQVNEVHPYNRAWSVFLEGKFRAPLAAH